MQLGHEAGLPVRMLRKKYAAILSASEGSRMVTHGVLFTGFFVAALLRMTGGNGTTFGAPDSRLGSGRVSLQTETGSGNSQIARILRKKMLSS